MFRLWQSQRRRGQNEPRQVLEQFADFIDRHGDSRFSPASAHDDSHYRALEVLEQAGVIPPPDEKGRRPRQKKIGGKNTRVYLVDPDALLASRDY